MSEPHRIDDLLKRLERLEAMEEIRHLKQRSAVAADPQMDIDMFVNLLHRGWSHGIHQLGYGVTGGATRFAHSWKSTRSPGCSTA